MIIREVNFSYRSNWFQRLQGLQGLQRLQRLYSSYSKAAYSPAFAQKRAPSGVFRPKPKGLATPPSAKPGELQGKLDWGLDKFPYKAAYCCTVEQVKQQLATFDCSNPISFDMEWSIVYRKGAEQRKTALIQLSNQSQLLLVHLARLENIPKELTSILEHPQTVKFGINIVADAQKLHRDYNVLMRGMVDLQHLAGVFDKEFAQKRRKSLKSLVERFLGRTMDKDKAVLGLDWESPILRPQQLAYASNDVYAGDLLFQNFSQRCAKYNMNIKEVLDQLTMHIELNDGADQISQSLKG